MPLDRDRLKADLIRHEGEVKRRGWHVVYDDYDGEPIKPGSHVRGYPTLGHGRNLSGRGITDAEALFLLGNDIDAVASELDARLHWWRQLDGVRQSALLNMGFNLGVTGLLGFGNMLAALKRRDYAEAAAEALNSKWANQVGRRAREIADMIRHGGD